MKQRRLGWKIVVNRNPKAKNKISQKYGKAITMTSQSIKSLDFPLREVLQSYFFTFQNE